MFAGADKLLFQTASRLRKQLTPAEEVVWNCLRSKPFGLKFRRQHPYLNYVLDFYCHSLKLVIEIDGSIHNEEEVKRNDKKRQEQLERNGLEVIRFSNDEIKSSLEKVIAKINELLILKTKPNEQGKQ